MARDATYFLCALQRKRCTPRNVLLRATHRMSVHQRRPMSFTHAWGPF